MDFDAGDLGYARSGCESHQPHAVPALVPACGGAEPVGAVGVRHRAHGRARSRQTWNTGPTCPCTWARWACAGSWCALTPARELAVKADAFGVRVDTAETGLPGRHHRGPPAGCVYAAGGAAATGLLDDYQSVSPSLSLGARLDGGGCGDRAGRGVECGAGVRQ